MMKAVDLFQAGTAEGPCLVDVAAGSRALAGRAGKPLGVSGLHHVPPTLAVNHSPNQFEFSFSYIQWR